MPDSPSSSQNPEVNRLSPAREEEKKHPSGDGTNHEEDPFGDEQNGEIRYRTMKWWQCGMIMIAETVSLGILSLPSAVAVLGLAPCVLLAKTHGQKTLITLQGCHSDSWTRCCCNLDWLRYWPIQASISAGA